MKEPSPFKITIENNYATTTASIPYDSTIDDIMTVISGMLVSHTFSEKQIEDWIMDRADILNDYYDRTTDSDQKD